jgi:hypothetical protein
MSSPGGDLGDNGFALRHGRQQEALTDREIVERLHELDFDRHSDLWKQLAAWLAEYALPVLVAWAVTSELAKKVAAQGGASSPKFPRTLRLQYDDARDLATDIVVVALRKFPENSVRKWDPHRGRSLRSYFVGLCLLEAGDVYQRWNHEQQQGSADLPLNDETQVDHRPGGRPDDQAEAKVFLDQLLDDDPVVRQLLELQDQGYSLAEIAKRLGQEHTESSLKTRRYRFLQRLARERFDA